MYKTLKEMFDDLCGGIVIDKAWVRKLNNYRVGFTLKNDDHMRFFGGNLFGVEVVRFSPSDREYLFHELLDVDEFLIESHIKKLPNVVQRFKVSSDAFNNACIWLIHHIHHSKNIDDALRHQAKMDVALMMNYRFFTSRMYMHFKYPANPEVATAVYASLSRKFAIKQYGNWNRVFDARCEEIIAKHSIHYKVLETMEDDIAIRNTINDIQGRIRSMCRILADVHYRMNTEGDKIGYSSSVMNHDGEAILKDRTKSIHVYGKHLETIVAERNSFIKPQLVSVIESAMPTMPPKQFTTTLEWLVAQSRGNGSPEVLGVLNDALTHAFGYLFENRQLVRNTSDLGLILTRLKGTYSSSRNSDPLLLDLRVRVESMVKKATKTKHAGNTAAVRTGVLLYIVARALTMQHFKQ